MHAPQTGLFFEAMPHHHYLELRLRPDVGADDARAALKAAVTPEPPRFRSITVALGPRLYTLLGADMPKGLVPFPGFEGAGEAAPSTQADLWVWVQGPTADENLLLMRRVLAALESCFDVTLQHQSLAGEGSRDLMGFIDGTGNPKNAHAKEAAALDTAGGSFLLAQTWHHRLEKFEALDQTTQEQVIGRTKYDDIELEGDAMPANSHVSRTDVKLDGVAQKVYRRSSVIGDAQKHGLYFISFACDLGRHDIQLRRMYGLTEDGLSDRILEFSEAVTSSYFYVPSRESLERLIE